MAAQRSVRGFLLGWGLVCLALGLRLGLLEMAHGLRPQGLTLGIVVVTLGVVGVEWLTRPTAVTDTAGPPWDWIPVAVVPMRCHEEWLGDVEEWYWAWCQQGYPRCVLRLWLLGCVLQWLETRVRYACYKVVWTHRWKKP
jgi:hypothetical protein